MRVLVACEESQAMACMTAAGAALGAREAWRELRIEREIRKGMWKLQQ